MVTKESVNDMCQTDTTLVEALIMGLGAFLIVTTILVLVLLPIQLLANWLGAGL